MVIMESTVGIRQATGLLDTTVQTLQRWESNDQLALGERTWICAGCGAHHDRDGNAAIDLQRLATGRPCGANGATRGEPGGDAGHCRRRWAGGRRESAACQARARSAGRLGAGRDR